MSEINATPGNKSLEIAMKRIRQEHRAELGAELKTWAEGRVAQIGYGGGPAAGERYAMQRLIGKLEELEMPEATTPIPKAPTGLLVADVLALAGSAPWR